MKKLKTACLVLLLSLGFVPRVARAQEWTRQSFLLPKGGFEITGDPARPTLVNMNVSRNLVLKPVEIPADFFWGVSDDVMLGITHEHGLRLNTGDRDSKFSNNYNDVGFGALIYLAGGRNYEVDLDTGVPFERLSPQLWVGGRVGVLGRANIGEHVALVYDPGIYLAFNRRDQGNQDHLSIPIWFYFQVTHVVAPFVGTGIEGQFNRFGNNFNVPLEGGVLCTVGHGIHIGGVLRFPNALGNGNTLDNRSLGFLGQFRF